MLKQTTLGPVILFALLMVSGSSFGDFVFDESTNGDLSDDRFTPTLLPVVPGSNQLFGTVGDADDDYFSFVLAPGQELTDIIVLEYSSTTNTTFLGINFGPIYDPEGNTQTLGFTAIGTDDIGFDVLQDLAASNGNFSGPLGPGTYSFWLDEATGPESYGLEFRVSGVPEPASSVVLGLMLIGMAKRKRN